MSRWSDKTMAAAMVLASAMLLAAGGCGEREQAREAVIHHYQVRGQITAMPGDRPGQELMIRHEAIDDFRDSRGESDPMPAMTMPFPPALGVSLEGFDVGDKVLATLEVQWEPEAGWAMTAIEKLPDDTELDFGGAGHGHDH